MKKATIKDVAREAGVSITLVSKVLNAKRTASGRLDCSVSDSSAQKILDAVKRLGYKPNKAAASLRKGRDNRIGVILPDISNGFFSDLARHIENEAYSAGYSVLFGSSDENSRKLGNLVDTFITDGVDGMIIIPCTGCEGQIAMATDRNIPIVLAIRDIPSMKNVGKVIPDSATAVEMALGHLYGNGFRKIEMVSSTMKISNATDREHFYREFMEQHSLSDFIRCNHVDDSNKSESMEYIVEDAVRRGVEALFFPSASLPLFAMKACKKLGVRVPEDLAIFGFDGGDNYQLTTPSISQIHYSLEDSAKESFGMLKRIITENAEPRTVILKPNLWIGGSTQKKQPCECSDSGAYPAGELVIRKLHEAIDMLKQDLQKNQI